MRTALVAAAVAFTALLVVSRFAPVTTPAAPTSPTGTAAFALIGLAGDEYAGQTLTLTGTPNVSSTEDIRAFDTTWKYILRFEVIDDSVTASMDGQPIQITCRVGNPTTNGGPFFPAFAHVPLTQCRNATLISQT